MRPPRGVRDALSRSSKCPKSSSMMTESCDGCDRCEVVVTSSGESEDRGEKKFRALEFQMIAGLSYAFIGFFIGNDLIWLDLC